MPYQYYPTQDYEEGLTDIPTQPKCEGITPGKVVKDGAGMERALGKGTATLVYTALTSAEFDALITYFGLANNQSSECTISLPVDDDRAFTAHNGIIHRPVTPREGKFQFGFWRNIQFRLTALEVPGEGEGEGGGNGGGP